MADENIATLQDEMSIFRPPIVRSATATLDRSLFGLTVPTAAARIANPKNISRYRNALGDTREILKLERFTNVRPDPDLQLAQKGGKCLILKPEVKPEDPTTWSTLLRDAVQKEEIGVFPYQLQFNYDYWNYYDIMTSILPLDAQGEIPVGFSQVGHIAHLNLRTEYLPYKTIIAQVLIDKNPGVTTVINKVDDVGTESEFRTFKYEVLAGPDDMNVQVSEEECTFKFDYSKVYWNSRLQTEHRRLVSKFKEGDVVVDVMAGVGPFAIPAGKKGVFVWANDLNPDSYKALSDAVTRNKVTPFVRPFNEDGHIFIHQAADSILALSANGQNTITIPGKPIGKHSRSSPDPPKLTPSKTLTIPSTINHFVMNLPASALSFLPSFSGLYAGHESLFAPETSRKLPLINVHCFSTKSEDNVRESKEIAERVGKELGLEEGRMRVAEGDPEGKGYWDRELEEGEVRVWDVREVAPKKRMFCAEFRLPAEVAFRARGGSAPAVGS